MKTKKGEPPEQSENRPQDNVSASSGHPHKGEISLPTPKSKPIRYGFMAAGARDGLGQAASILKNHGLTLPFFSDISREEMVRYAEAADFIKEIVGRLDDAEPAPGTTCMEVVDAANSL